MRKGERPRGEGASDEREKIRERQKKLAEKNSYTKVGVILSIASLVILIAGILLTKSAEAIATKSGLGSNLVGLVLLGFATGLPELSSIRSAVKLGRYEMAIGDIFGTNLWNVAIIGVADLLYRGGSVFAHSGAFEQLASLLAISLTCVYMIGLLERRDKTVLRMGIDSAIVILLYGVGLAMLYSLRGSGS